MGDKHVAVLLGGVDFNESEVLRFRELNSLLNNKNGMTINLKGVIDLAVKEAIEDLETMLSN